jgi:hypothetical protein
MIIRLSIRKTLFFVRKESERYGLEKKISLFSLSSISMDQIFFLWKKKKLI